jgi:nucleotide-binding universal stress UspA family protein
MLRHILYTTDGSTAAQRAGDYAASLAIRFGAKVTVLHAYTRQAVAMVEFAHANPDSYASEKDAEAMAEQTAVRLQQMGVSDVEVRVVTGQPTSVILGVAESINPDVIVIGARGLSTWKGMSMGSVSLAVVLRADIPVFVVK